MKFGHFGDTYVYFGKKYVSGFPKEEVVLEGKKHFFYCDGSLSGTRTFASLNEVVAFLEGRFGKFKDFVTPKNGVLGKIVVFELKGKSFFLHRDEIKPLEIDFMFPGVELGLPGTYILRQAKVPYTFYVENEDGILQGVYWIIWLDTENEYFDVLYYPFNVSSSNVCSPMRRLSKNVLNNNVRWYSEIPNTDILSLRKPEYTCILLYALKRGRHELLPGIVLSAVHTGSSSGNKKVRVSVDFTFKTEKEEIKVKEKFVLKMREELVNIIGGDIFLEDTIEIEKLKVSENV